MIKVGVKSDSKIPTIAKISRKIRLFASKSGDALYHICESLHRPTKCKWIISTVCAHSRTQLKSVSHNVPTSQYINKGSFHTAQHQDVRALYLFTRRRVEPATLTISSEQSSCFPSTYVKQTADFAQYQKFRYNMGTAQFPHDRCFFLYLDHRRFRQATDIFRLAA